MADDGVGNSLMHRNAFKADINEFAKAKNVDASIQASTFLQSFALSVSLHSTNPTKHTNNPKDRHSRINSIRSDKEG